MDICNAIVKEGRIPETWRKSWMVTDDRKVTYESGGCRLCFGKKAGEDNG